MSIKIPGHQIGKGHIHTYIHTRRQGEEIHTQNFTSFTQLLTLSFFLRFVFPPFPPSHILLTHSFIHLIAHSHTHSLTPAHPPVHFPRPLSHILTHSTSCLISSISSSLVSQPLFSLSLYLSSLSTLTDSSLLSLLSQSSHQVIPSPFPSLPPFHRPSSHLSFIPLLLLFPPSHPLPSLLHLHSLLHLPTHVQSRIKVQLQFAILRKRTGKNLIHLISE